MLEVYCILTQVGRYILCGTIVCNLHTKYLFGFFLTRDARKLHPRNFITAYLSVNSIRYKFDEIRELLTDRIVDLLFIAETKLDATFNDNLFSVDGYKLHRRDRNSNVL
jgi:hypothetical protein